MADDTPPRDPAQEIDALHHYSTACRNEAHDECAGTCDYGDHPCTCLHHTP